MRKVGANPKVCKSISCSYSFPSVKGYRRSGRVRHRKQMRNVPVRSTPSMHRLSHFYGRLAAVQAAGTIQYLSSGQARHVVKKGSTLGSKTPETKKPHLGQVRLSYWFNSRGRTYRIFPHRVTLLLVCLPVLKMYPWILWGNHLGCSQTHPLVIKISGYPMSMKSAYFKPAEQYTKSQCRRLGAAEVVGR